jgi:hypothetical protein
VWAFVDAPESLPVNRTAYFIIASIESSGPIVKTAGRANLSFSTVIAVSCIEKSNGVKLNLETFCKGYTNAFFLMRTVSMPTPVMARYASSRNH